LASCLQLYDRAGDISATGDVARMSCRAAHTDGVRVLVVEDHATLADRIAQGLRQAGMAADVVYDGAAALDAAAQTAYDVIVLDRDLPVLHGDRVCRDLAGSGPRILMLTAAADVDDRVEGLELGADDYLGKPFAFAELVARVRALSRRARTAPPVLRCGDLTVDRARHRARRGSRPLTLSRKEFGILETLLAADGALLSAEELLEQVWDTNTDPFSNIVSVTMARLRRKLGDPPLIETVVGKGYRM
jgi:DNA-binding response OmpR family regulator